MHSWAFMITNALQLCSANAQAYSSIKTRQMEYDLHGRVDLQCPSWSQSHGLNLSAPGVLFSRVCPVVPHSPGCSSETSPVSQPDNVTYCRGSSPHRNAYLMWEHSSNIGYLLQKPTQNGVTLFRAA